MQIVHLGMRAYPAGWLNDDGWADEPDKPAPPTNANGRCSWSALDQGLTDIEPGASMNAVAMRETAPSRLVAKALRKRAASGRTARLLRTPLCGPRSPKHSGGPGTCPCSLAAAPSAAG